MYIDFILLYIALGKYFCHYIFFQNKDPNGGLKVSLIYHNFKRHLKKNHPLTPIEIPRLVWSHKSLKRWDTFKPPLLLLCLFNITRLVKFSYFLVGKWKEVSTYQETQHLDTICKSYEGSKFILVDTL